ncbi:RagB/SusD family nutrient uptake outer membrane protein [Arenibacter nanhaiticus]|nr:RagB/SusD family nutrient uptake outer membrane protein [Arenibacter nanhaiticus]
MMKINNINKLMFLFILVLTQCSEDPLDKRPLGAISEEVVWNDENLAIGFLNNIYSRALPGWATTASQLSDDAHGENGLMYGEAQPGSMNIYSGNYKTIKDINLLLAKIGTGTIGTEAQNLMSGQALFLRAHLYFKLVAAYGGVPLVLDAKDKSDIEALQVPRNKTSECIAQILNDLDDAADLLPVAYSNAAEEYGRITKGAALAYKGRVLLHYASEQFDPAQDKGRWQAAYDANKAAVALLSSNGKGLHPSYENLWFDESESNPEAILIKRYTLDQSHNRDAGCRPFIVGTNGESFDKPTKSLVDAFPMKDGKAINDPTSSYTYNPTALWVDRDPRFSATIAWNGAVWPLNNPAPNRTSDLEWTFQESAIEGQADSRITPTSFNCRKAIDGSIEGGAASLSSPTDWIEIRYAEVLLNLAEAANEVGLSMEAYNILSQIRDRAGIESGLDGLYGLQAGMDQNELRMAIMHERRLELVFEGKRSSDLRRRRMYDAINGTYRQGYRITKTASFDALDPSEEILDDRIALEEGINNGSIDLNDPSVYNTYFNTELRSVERFGNIDDDGSAINYLDNYYFFDIPQDDLNKNPHLEQTKGWPGGTFDPLQ